MNKNREKALEGLTRIAQVIVSVLYNLSLQSFQSYKYLRLPQ
jgi:hypothetical protein